MLHLFKPAATIILAESEIILSLDGDTDILVYKLLFVSAITLHAGLIK